MSFLKGYLGAKQLAIAEQEAARQKAQQEEMQKKLTDRAKFGGAFSNMMLEDLAFKGEFKAGPMGLEFGSVPGTSFTAFPTMSEAYSKYKKVAKLYNQEPDYAEFMQSYKAAEAQYGQAFSKKLRTMQGAGIKPKDISSVIAGNPELNKAFNHFLGTDMAPQLAPFVPETPKGAIGGAAASLAENMTGLGVTAAARGVGAFRTGGGLKAGINPLGGMTSAQLKSSAAKVGQEVIKKGSHSAITKSLGVSAKGGAKSAVEKYIAKNGVSKLITEVVKKAGPKQAAKILGKGVLGMALKGSGVGAVAGLALDAITIAQIASLIQDVTKEAAKGEGLKEMLIGGGSPDVTPGTTY